MSKVRFRAVLALLAVTVPFLLCAGPIQGLRRFADRKHLYIGNFIGAPTVRNPVLASILERDANILTPGNEMKWLFVHPQKDVYDFRAADQIVAFAQQHGMKVRGHNLCWHVELPDWLTKGGFSGDELRTLLHEHILTVVSHFEKKFPGVVVAWDVVNEGVDRDHLRQNIWAKINPADPAEYMRLAFQWAHEAAPRAKLYYNDFDGEGMNTKSDVIYRLVTELKDSGVPIDGVGLQMHVRLNRFPEPNQIADNIDRLGVAGFEVEMTETDVSIPDSDHSPFALDQEADVYRQLLQVCEGSPYCKGFIMGAIGDADSWIPLAFKGWGRATIYDQNYAPKPAYYALLDELETAPNRDTFHRGSLLFYAASMAKKVGTGGPVPGGYVLASRGYIMDGAVFPVSGTYRFDITAYGSQDQGWPRMILVIDGRPAVAFDVKSTTWGDYSATWNLSAGYHTVGIDFPNDAYNGPGQDRNLIVGTIQADEVGGVAATPRGAGGERFIPAARGYQLELPEDLRDKNE